MKKSHYLVSLQRQYCPVTILKIVKFVNFENKNWQFFRIRAFSIHIRKVQFEVQSF